MNGRGRLVKEGLDIVGEFFADHFVRPLENHELDTRELKEFING